MPQPPALSVIMPVANLPDKPRFRAALRSLLSQSCPDFEALLICSHGLQCSLQGLPECADRRIIFLDDQGHEDAGCRRNTGIEHSTGRYIVFMDSDDAYYGPQSLQTMLDAIERHGVLAAGGSCLIRDELQQRFIYRGDLINERYEHLTDFEHFQNESGFYRFIYNGNYLRGSCRFRPLRRFQDSVFMVECLEQAGRLALIPDIVYVYTKGHRQLVWNCDMLLDHLHGVELVLQLAQQRNYRMLAARMLRNIINTWRLRRVGTDWPDGQRRQLRLLKSRLAALMLARPGLLLGHPLLTVMAQGALVLAH